MLSSQLSITTEMMQAIGFDRLAAHLPYELIEQALNAHGVASIRRRRLPAEQVVWLIIALALFRRQSMEEVLSTLDLALPDARIEAVCKSAIAQARTRIGQGPLQWLFEQTAKAWCAQEKAANQWKGLSLWAVDGTTFRVPDSPENRLWCATLRQRQGGLLSAGTRRQPDGAAHPSGLGHRVWPVWPERNALRQDADRPDRGPFPDGLR
jgi:hypothetical protein